MGEPSQRPGAADADVLCLCGSRKPAPDQPSVKSASRELLNFAWEGVRAGGAVPAWLDLRDLNLPFWDGRGIEAYGLPDLTHLHEAVEASGMLLLSVPAYWGGVSGTVKNIFDLLGDEPFRSTWVGTVVVGMDEAAAWHAAGQLRTTLGLLGAWVPPYQLVVGDPVRHPDPSALIHEARRYGAYMACLATGRIRPPLAGGPAAPVQATTDGERA